MVDYRGFGKSTGRREEKLMLNDMQVVYDYLAVQYHENQIIVYGRSLGSGGLIKPNYSVDDYGTVVVDILVNAKGDVVEATIGKGTNTPNTNLRNEAIRAAKRTKFNTVSSVTNQKGTITYKFNLN